MLKLALESFIHAHIPPPLPPPHQHHHTCAHALNVVLQITYALLFHKHLFTHTHTSPSISLSCTRYLLHACMSEHAHTSPFSCMQAHSCTPSTIAFLPFFMYTSILLYTDPPLPYTLSNLCMHITLFPYTHATHSTLSIYQERIRTGG